MFCSSAMKYLSSRYYWESKLATSRQIITTYTAEARADTFETKRTLRTTEMGNSTLNYWAHIWARACGREDLLPNVSYKFGNFKLCAAHFEDRMYLNDLKNRLLPTAVPTLFPLMEYSSSTHNDHSYCLKSDDPIDTYFQGSKRMKLEDQIAGYSNYGTSETKNTSLMSPGT
ncbi:hypothetical protein FQA39_LY02031 [Lamprigera yunnana]|nr:hypothetical protein FQA39_LY02031 [Lamprigera yunnana]